MFFINDSQFYAICLGESLLLVTVPLNIVVLCYSERKAYAGMYRKVVFVMGLASISIIYFIHALVKLTVAETDASHILLQCLFFSVYQCTIGPFYWIYVPEVLKIKDFCYPMACMWGVQFVTALSYSMKDKPNVDSVFYLLFSAISLVMAVLIHKFAVETKGKPWIVVATLLI
jgi:hypothetical protein